MQISTKGRYALQMLLDLAAHREEGYIPMKDIALRQGISKNYLEQIMPLLHKTSIVKTTRGFQGGYMLARTPAEYSVGEILRLTEGGIAPLDCLQSGPCGKTRCCTTKDVWKGLQRVMLNYLDGITLQDILDNNIEKFPAEISEAYLDIPQT